MSLQSTISKSFAGNLFKNTFLYVFGLLLLSVSSNAQELTSIEKATKGEKILNHYFSSRPYANLVRTEFNSGIMQFNIKNYTVIRELRAEIIESYVNDNFSFDTIGIYISRIAKEYKLNDNKEPLTTKSKDFSTAIKAPNGPCVNMDFESVDFTGWNLFTGNVDANPFGYVSVAPTTNWTNYPSANSGAESHYIVTGPNVDASVGITMVNPFTGNNSAILGDLTTAGYGAASMKQTFLVDANNANFTYYYAVVLQDPNHSAGDQPFFRIRMYDAQGNSIQCAEYDVFPGNGDAAWQINSTANFIDWQTAFIPLQAYIGQNVTVEFVVGDCNQGGHWGYAYVDATCEPMTIVASDTVVCGNPITITAPAGATSYQWSNGMTGQSIQVAQAGNYVVTMTAVSGCAITLDIDIYEAASIPIPFFEADTVCQGNATGFIDQSSSSNGIANWNWDFDNDGIYDATANNPSYTFNAAGTFPVSLQIIDQQGCFSDTLINVTVGDYPTPAFSASSVCEGTATTFTDLSVANSGNISTWNWDFQSDGNIDNTTQNPTNGYISAGVYNVTLEVGIAGCLASVTQPINVNPIPSPNFNWTSVCSGFATGFMDNSTVNGGNVVQWQWNFGENGAISNAQNPQYTYSNSGNYITQLTVTSDSGCINSYLNNVTVYEHPNANFISSDVCLGQGISFADVSNTNFGTINAWYWDVDANGTVDYVNQFPVHTYNSSGTYNPVLIVETDEGCRDTVTLPVTVFPPPVIAFTSSLPEGCATWCVDFTNNTTITSGTIQNYYWNFGDTYSSIDADPSHCFENNTQNVLNFDISLTAVSDQGCSSDATDYGMITVFPNPTAEFTFNPSPTDIYHTEVSFYDQSSGADYYSWDFAGLDNSTSSDPVFTFPSEDAGVYEVCQEIQNTWGCQDEICHDVIVEGEMLVYVPNAFTPDGDGINDNFKPVLMGHDPDNYKFMIFDRWGLLIYQTEDEFASWDGRHKDNSVVQDAYVWKLVVKDKYKGQQQEYIGHVTVLK